jgi:hypothetical protein
MLCGEEITNVLYLVLYHIFRDGGDEETDKDQHGNGGDDEP